MSAEVVSFNPLHRRLTIPEHFLLEADKAIAQAISGKLILSREGFAEVPADRERFPRELVATALAYLQHGPVARQKTPAISSYILKHCAERWGRELGFAPYVANGDLIVAALHLGIKFKRDIGPNALLAVRIIRDLQT